MSGGGAVVRRARSEDVKSILDLPAHYERPRSYFEPFYLGDPGYRPDQPWVAESGARLVAHLRVFDRSIRAGGATLRVAAIGNVITAPGERGRGHAGRLLEAVLAESQGLPYSLLGAYRLVLYERYGWANIDQDLTRATLPSGEEAPAAIERFAEEDLPEIMRLYDETNAGRSGTTVRSPEYWRSQLEWLEEDRDGFLLARGDDGALAGYVRSRADEDAVEILELSIGPDEAEIGRALLSAAASRRGGRLRASLPPSLMALFRPNEAKVTSEFGPMGRVLDIAALAAALEPVWTRRARDSGLRGGSLYLSTSEGSAEVRVSEGAVRLEPSGEPEDALGEGDLAHLLFRGFDAAAGERLGARAEASLLQALFPEQDFVVWRADAF